MEDDSCSWVDTRIRVPGTNFLRTSSPPSCYSDREVEAQRGLEQLSFFGDQMAAIRSTKLERNVASNWSHPRAGRLRGQAPLLLRDRDQGHSTRFLITRISWSRTGG